MYVLSLLITIYREVVQKDELSAKAKNADELANMTLEQGPIFIHVLVEFSEQKVFYFIFFLFSAKL